MTFHEIVISILVVAMCIYIGMTILEIAQRQDETMFREEFIWYDRYTIVREMVLRGMPEEDIIYQLMRTKYPDWEFDEITQMIEIARSY